jgi:D-hydroxyproline dehydrogenase subunit beta
MSSDGASWGTAEVVVLGAGIIGTAIAAQLSATGADVLVIESENAPGMGSSGRCDGNVLLQTKHHDVLLRLTRRSIETYRRWEQELDLDVRFEQTGSLVFMTDADQLGAARERLEHLRQHDIAADLVDGDQLRELEPNLVGDLPGAIHCHEDAEVYPPAVVAGLLMTARRQGARLVTGTKALELLVGRDGAVRGVRTSAGVVHTPRVVNALGPWSGQLIVPPSAPTIPVLPRQGVLVVTEECPGVIRHNIREASYITDRSGHDTEGRAKISFAAEPTYRGNLLLGSSRHFGGYDVSVSREILSAIMERALLFVPALQRVHVMRAFAGLRPWTPDNLPLVGPCAKVPGYVVATGHEGEGIGLAPATAELVAIAVLGTEPDDEQRDALDQFAPDRFEGDVLTTGRATSATASSSANGDG